MRAQELLASIPFFADALDDNELQRLAENAESRTFGEGDTLIREGDDATELLVIASGEVAIRVDDGGEEKQVATLGAGDFVGEMSLMTGSPCAASVIALSPVAALQIGKPAIQSLLDTSPHLLEQFAATLYKRQTELDELYEHGFWDRLAPRREDTVAIMRRYFG